MSVLARMRDSLRSFFLGPFGSGDKYLAQLFGGQAVRSGVQINEDVALTYTAVWACVNLIAGTLGSLPLILYRQRGGNKDRYTASPLYRILHDEPNEEMSSVSFRQTLQTHVLLWGNAFAEIQRDGGGRVAALHPIEPWRVAARREPGGPLRYLVWNRDGTQSTLAPRELLHVPGLSPNGVWGYSVIGKAREAIGLGLATERFGAAFFGNSARPGGILKHPRVLSEAAKKNLRESIERFHQGVDNAGRVFIAEEGMDFMPIGVPPEDAQFLETRKFQVSEVARLFGVPPHMVGDVERSTSWGAGIEQQAIGFIKFTMRRWLVAWEQELNRKLISPLERNLQFIEFLVDGLERGDFQSRVNGYVALRQAGLTTANRVAAIENWEPFGPVGDVLLVPANMIPAEQAGQAPEPPPAPPAPTEPPAEPDDRDLQEIREDLQKLMELGRRLLDKPDPQPVDLTPVLERMPAPVDLEPVLEKVDLAPVMARLDAVEAERRALQERVAAVLPSVRALIEGAVRHFVSREAERARRNASSPEKLAEWSATFYARQEDSAVKALRDAVHLYSVMVGRPDDTEAVIRARVSGYVADSRQALDALVTAPPEDLRAAVETLTARWESERPAAFADALMQEVIAHV